MMINKTGDAHIDHLIDKNAETIQRLEKFAEEKAKENDKLIELIYESRTRRLDMEACI